MADMDPQVLNELVSELEAEGIPKDALMLELEELGFVPKRAKPLKPGKKPPTSSGEMMKFAGSLLTPGVVPPRPKSFDRGVMGQPTNQESSSFDQTMNVVGQYGPDVVLGGAGASAGVGVARQAMKGSVGKSLIKKGLGRVGTSAAVMATSGAAGAGVQATKEVANKLDPEGVDRDFDESMKNIGIKGALETGATSARIGLKALFLASKPGLRKAAAGFMAKSSGVGKRTPHRSESFDASILVSSADKVMKAPTVEEMSDKYAEALAKRGLTTLKQRLNSVGSGVDPAKAKVAVQNLIDEADEVLKGTAFTNVPSPKPSSAITRAGGAAMPAAQTKVSKALTIEDALVYRQALSKKIQTASPEEIKLVGKRWFEMKDQLDDHIMKNGYREFQDLNRDMARSIAGDRFRNLIPRDQQGNIDLGRFAVAASLIMRGARGGPWQQFRAGLAAAQLSPKLQASMVQIMQNIAEETRGPLASGALNTAITSGIDNTVKGSDKKNGNNLRKQP